MPIRKDIKLFTALAAAAVMVLTAPATAQAMGPPSAPVASPWGGEGPDGEDDPIESESVEATYEGRTIDLSVDWEGATVCAEVALGDVRCFATEGEFLVASAEIDPAHADLLESRENSAAGNNAAGLQPSGADIGVQAIADCARGWTCLWDTTSFTGRRLQWNLSGTKKLADWGFRDMAGSICRNHHQGGAELVDYRTLQPDPRLFIPADSCYNLNSVSYVWGGTWNNKADEIRLG